MRQCPKCKSTRISTEKWHEAMPNDFKNGGIAALRKTGNLVCNDCRFTSSPRCFPKKDVELFFAESLRQYNIGSL